MNADINNKNTVNFKKYKIAHIKEFYHAKAI